MSDSDDHAITPYLDYLRYERRLSPRTCESYQRDLKDYLNCVHNTKQILGKRSHKHKSVSTWQMRIAVALALKACSVGYRLYAVCLITDYEKACAK